ncbi:MAG: hypothetical protein J4O03_13060 [Chloroflexi bacterium]|nr:hypothetical protein [Chloroflexota bacterium]MCI0794386.1 hypothetical protein [Chloroflexota bacterium]MCI0799723.1 hypothetical protein [Chloroflexota bacterium]
MRHRHAGFRASGYRWWDDSVIGYPPYTPEHGFNPLTGVTLAWSFTGLAGPNPRAGGTIIDMLRFPTGRGCQPALEASNPRLGIGGGAGTCSGSC